MFSLTRALDIRFQALAKRTRKSTQVCKTGLACGLAKGGQTDSQVNAASLQNRTCVRTCNGWPNELASRHKSTQVCKTGLACGLAKGGQTDSQVNASLQNRTCVRTCDGWPNELVSRHKSTNFRTNLWRNGFASRLASSRKSHKPYISRIYS